MRLAELMGTLSLASDAAMGMPPEHGLRAAAVAVRLGELAGATEVERADAFYLALMRYVGCTADSDLAAHVFGDEIAARGKLYGADFAAPGDILPRVAAHAISQKGVVRGVAAAARTIALMPQLMNTAQSHCEVGDRLAQRFGFGAPFRAALQQSYERWDGKGWPSNVAGEALAMALRLAHVGELVEIAHRSGGVDAARALTKKRARKEVDPKLVERFDRSASEICAVLDVTSAWATAMDAEPPAWRSIEGEDLDEALRALGHFADLKSRYTRGHSSGVARLVHAAATTARISDDTVRNLTRAAFIHDLGRVAVSASIWDKATPLTDLEREAIRSHTYASERILARAPALADVAGIATLAHERIDGTGYHRRLDAAACRAPARLLAAADVYHAMIEARPQRPARAPSDAATELEAMARAGGLCPDAVKAVLAAAGHAVAPNKQREHPAGLTEREVEVLRLVARGLTNKEIAAALDVSVKTVGNHLQNAFPKLGVTTRAGATMFAMQHGLLEA